MLLLISIFLLFNAIHLNNGLCIPTPTTVIGTHAPTGPFCSGDLIFEETFDTLDLTKWLHEVNIGGNGNGEFQWYSTNSTNLFVQDGRLHIRPTLTADVFGEDFIQNGFVDLGAECTTSNINEGCIRQATPDNIIPPIRSGKVRTHTSFAFKFGRTELIAKLPAGDWIWPAMWMLPTDWVYGGWPLSGEIDLMESRGNRHMYNAEGLHIGVEEVGMTLHFGNAGWSAWDTSTFSRRSIPGRGWDQRFNRYQMEWTPHHIRFFINDFPFGTVPVGTGFFDRGNFEGYNPWINGTLMAPFDKEFHLLLNVAVGATNGYFPETGNVGGKPWSNSSPRAMAEFWENRDQWLPTWYMDVNDGYDSSMIIDSVRVWAL